MIIAWVMYGLIVGGFMVVAAYAVDRACRIIGWPTRWVWLGALLLLTVLVGVAPYRRDLVTHFASSLVPGNRLPDVVQWRDVHSWHGPGEVAESLLRSVTVQADQVIVLASRSVPNTWGYSFALVWGGVSLGLLLVLGIISWRVYRARNSWLVAEVHGVRVCVTPTVGPAVVGVLRPVIVIPHWLLGCGAEEQRLVVAHEREHVRAHDALVLAVACVGVALVPWHPAVWWIFSRLRLAIELDCDRRVLRQGVAPRAYGAVLIELAGRCSRLPIGAPALADRASHLEQRILAMKPARLLYPKLWCVTLSSIAGAALVVACATEGPSTAPKSQARVARLSAQATPTKDSLTAMKGEVVDVDVEGLLVVDSVKKSKGPSASALHVPDAANGVMSITVTQ